LGHSALIVDLRSTGAGRPAALLNGSVLVALPPGVEPDGKPRLYWQDAGGRAQFAYSLPYTYAQAQAGSSELGDTPLAQLRTLGGDSLALDPQLEIVTPSDPRITDNSLALHWQLPATMQSKPLVNPFQPEKGLGLSTQLRAVFPLKGSSDLPVALYFGGLSCVGTPGELPTLPGVQPAPFDCEWLAWEGEVSWVGAGPAPALKSKVQSPKAKGDPDGWSSEPTVEQIEIDDADPSVGADLASARPKEEANTDPSTTAGGDKSPPYAEDKSVPSSDSKTSATEVTPGTLALPPETFHVPLKPITGSGAGMTPAPNTAATPLGPTQLSPQAGAALSAPATEMVLIPAGSFEMGTAAGPLDERADEAPQHSVELPAYYIDKLPVTNRQFYNFVISSGYKPAGNWQKYYEPATADLPVRAVSFADAAAYARWAGKRLPTEAEWEKAARGTDARTYPWGNDWSADTLPRGENYYALVGSPKIASPYGVLAMCGLLWQWTSSNYAAYPFNPKAAGEKKVLRGGCFSNGRNIVRCANRYPEQAEVALNTFTFRCAKDAK
jgi:formylglycine-generating enzyme required for sulfatase activity